jgi:hypothetical protein
MMKNRFGAHLVACPTRRAVAGALIGVALLAPPDLANAQTPPSGKPATPPEIMEPPNESTTPPPDPGAGDSQPKEPLSKQLDQGDGVLEPPRGIDPEIKKPVPDDFKGKMPVIPPPGSPGGNPNVEPK